jgi:hypothetical protein
MNFPRFQPRAERVVPKDPQPVSQHDAAADARSTGAAIESLTEKALRDIRRAPVPHSREVEQVTEGSVIEALTRAALPASEASARALQRARMENARQQPKNDTALKLAAIQVF